MKHFLVLALLLQLSTASTLTLQKVLASAHHTNPLRQSIDQQKLYLHAKNLADTASAPIELYGSGTQAKPLGRDKLFEYTLGLSKNIKLGNTQALEERITQLNNEATLLEADKTLLNFENGIKNLYHQHCLDKRNSQSVQENYNEFVKLYQKKQKAYTYKEISKAELMQLKIEKEHLYGTLQTIIMQQKISKEKLFILGGIYQTPHTSLSCSDLLPIRASVPLAVDTTFRLTKEAHDKRVESTQTTLQRHSKAIDSLNLSVEYAKEFEIDKYTVGVSVPLNFTSRQSEQERVASMYQNASLDLSYQQTMKENKSASQELKNQLKSDVMMITSIQNRLNDYQKTLLPLIKKSYELGESTVIEYLLNRQNYHQLKQALYATQKAYYQTLFTLYTLHEIKDKK